MGAEAKRLFRRTVAPPGRVKVGRFPQTMPLLAANSVTPESCRAQTLEQRSGATYMGSFAKYVYIFRKSDTNAAGNQRPRRQGRAWPPLPGAAAMAPPFPPSHSHRRPAVVSLDAGSRRPSWPPRALRPVHSADVSQ